MNDLRRPSSAAAFVAVALAAVVSLLAAPVPAAAQLCCPPHTHPPGPWNEVTQEFPSGGPFETGWRVRYAHGIGKGLYITGAWFKKDVGAPWMRVLWDARLADIFVPYHKGSPRFYDLTQFRFGLVPATAADAGCCGVVLDGFVIKEVRDRGVLWKDDMQVRRGEELVLWATLDAANYNYIMQYSFRDDGSIGFRVAGTAANLPSLPWEPHMHDALWRVDVDLNGFPNDSALHVRHIEMGLVGIDQALGLAGETWLDWNDLQFTHVRVQDTVAKNGHGQPISYDMIPFRAGTARHQETFSHHDFWITRYRGTELNYSQLPNYLNGESVTNTDVVLWHISPVHHHPRREDGEMVGNVWQGVALAMWTGFDLRPRNLFDRTPLHP